MHGKNMQSPEEMVQRLLTGDRRTAARLITRVENGSEDHNDLMKRIYPHTGKSSILGITGSGGSGKSSLIDHLINRFRQQD